MRRLVRPPSPAMVVAVIGLIVALTATASALPGRDSVTKDDIRTGAVGRSEITVDGVAGPELREDSVGLSELREEVDGGGGLTGAYIVESSLGTVPRAAVADRATTADGATVANGLAQPQPTGSSAARGTPPS
jgi:hypothetical protein